jgi:hypothetical protein
VIVEQMLGVLAGNVRSDTRLAVDLSVAAAAGAAQGYLLGRPQPLA